MVKETVPKREPYEREDLFAARVLAVTDRRGIARQHTESEVVTAAVMTMARLNGGALYNNPRPRSAVKRRLQYGSAKNPEPHDDLIVLRRLIEIYIWIGAQVAAGLAVNKACLLFVQLETFNGKNNLLYEPIGFRSRKLAHQLNRLCYSKRKADFERAVLVGLIDNDRAFLCEESDLLSPKSYDFVGGVRIASTTMVKFEERTSRVSKGRRPRLSGRALDEAAKDAFETFASHSFPSYLAPAAGSEMIYVESLNLFLHPALLPQLR